MIIDLTFSGLGPFKAPVTLTFEASNDEHLADAYVRDIALENGKKIKLLRVAILYGANAAGKTTVLEALSLLDSLVTSPVKDSEAEIDANYFAFDNTATEQSAELTVKFVRAGKVYRYQLRLAKNSILRETLEYQATPPDGTKFVLIYQRASGDTPSQSNFTYGPNQKLNKAEQEKLEAELLPNTTMLSVLNRKMTVQNPMIQDAYSWFKEQLMGEVTPKTNLTQWVTHQLDSQKIDQNRLIQVLNQAGIPIANLNVVGRQLSAVEMDILSNAPSDEVRNRIMDSFSKRNEVHTIYKIDGNEYQLKLNSQESLGTQRYYGLAGLLSVVCPESSDASHCKILSIDEIEHSLHPDLLEHFLVTFLNDAGNSQLIATTHYRELLQNNLLFRDDVIWFVDKAEASLASELYCLHDVKTNAGLRATSSVYNFYKHGRLGAVPKLKT
ncbi:ATP-binding protein [soil metagenome]